MASALTVTLSVDNSSVKAGQLVNVTATITDSGTTPTDWELRSGFASVNAGDAASRGHPVQLQSTAVAASGTTHITWGERFYTNGQTLEVTNLVQFKVGLTVVDEDGNAWSCAVGDQPTVNVTPNNPPGIQMPVPGEARFDSNINSYMVPTLLAGH